MKPASFLMFIGGALAGAAAALLFAPASGEETRKKIKDFSEEKYDEFKDLCEKEYDRMKDKYEEFKAKKGGCGCSAKEAVDAE